MKVNARTTQMAFDVDTKTQKQIRLEALQADINPSNRIRQILGLKTMSNPVRPRLSISLTEEDFNVLARKFNLARIDKITLKRRSIQCLIDYSQQQHQSNTTGIKTDFRCLE